MTQSRHQAIVLLTTIQQRLEQVLPPSRLLAISDFYVLMIESRTWGYFHPTLGGFDTRANPSPPRVDADENGERDRVLVISQAAAQAIATGDLPFRQEQNPHSMTPFWGMRRSKMHWPPQQKQVK